MTRTLVYRCPTCRLFTFAGACPKCKTATKSPLPPKFSPEDPYGAYRRRLKLLGPPRRPG